MTSANRTTNAGPNRTTATTPTAALLVRAERPDPAFGAADVHDWPNGTVERLVRLGVLAPLGPAETFACDACGFDHVERVLWVTGEGPDARAFVPCATAGAVPIDPAALRRWAVRLPALAHAMASAVGASGGGSERVPQRVWKLGTVRAGGRVWAAFLAIGLARADGAAVVEAAPELRAANALVFVPATVPTEAVWSADRAPVVVPLIDLLKLGANGLTADREALLSALPTAARPVAKEAARPFAPPPGTTWEHVTLVVEDHHVRVGVGSVLVRFGFAEAGFGDGRAANAPDELWTLLGLFARHRGTLGTNDAVNTKPITLRQKVGTLRNRLRALLSIEDDPFHRTVKGRPYRTRFAIRRDGPLTFPTPPGATWEDVTLTETATGIDIAVTTETRTVARGTAAGGAGEGTVRTDERHHSHALTDLGLTHPDNNPTPAGAALVALLRAGGRLDRPSHAPELLDLGAVLTRVFQLDGPPLDFDPKRGTWVTQFEAVSHIAPLDPS